MESSKKYTLFAFRCQVEVSEEVYRAYYQMLRQERTLAEKDIRNGTVSYNALDTDEITGEEMMPDVHTCSVEDAAIKNLLCEKMYRCLALLTAEERDLIHALYFEGLTERKLALRTGIAQKTINDRKTTAFEPLVK